MTTFYTADLHFGHANIIKHCNRPFDTVEAMDRALIENWNTIVGDDDEVWVLGDVTLNVRHLPLVRELRGKKQLVAGNHDLCHRMRSRWARFEGLYLDAGFENVWTRGVFRRHYLSNVVDPSVLQVVTVDLAHLPYHGDSQERDRFDEWRPRDEGRVLLHGHVHDRWRVAPRQVNVGVDVWGFTPVSRTELLTQVELALETDRATSLLRDHFSSVAEGSTEAMDGDGRPRPA